MIVPIYYKYQHALRFFLIQIFVHEEYLQVLVIAYRYGANMQMSYWENSPTYKPYPRFLII